MASAAVLVGPRGASSSRADRRSPERLCAELRTGTRREHLAVEAAFALEARLSDRSSYSELLRALRGFYGPVEAALAGVAGWGRLSPPLEVASRGRAGLIDRDLAALGADGPASRGGSSPGPVLASLADGLGCLYVLEGSALGGRLIAREARRALGEDLPLAFFSSAGRHDLGADWRALQAALDGFGAGHGRAARRAVLESARATFAALEAWLEREAPLR